MVTFEEYVRINVKTGLMRDVLKLLFDYGPMTEKKIRALLLSVYSREVKMNTLYTNLEALEKEGMIISQPVTSNGRRGRDPNEYKLSEGLLMRYKEREGVLHFSVKAYVAPRKE